MENKGPVETCSKCGRTYENDSLNFVCPYCGHVRWGEILMFLIIGLVCLWVFFSVAPGISSNTWRVIVRWVTGIFGFTLPIAVIVGIFQALGAPEQPLEKPAEEHTATPAAAKPRQVEAAAPNPIQGTPIQKPAEITWSSIFHAGQKGDYEELARMLVTLDKRSDREYGSDQDAYKKTCGLIKDLGKELDRRGGEDLMKQVLTRAGSFGCNMRFVEGEWNGIGTWLG